METIDFSSWLNDQLIINNLNQSELARRSGLNRAVISNLINNKHPSPDIATLNAIARGLKLDPLTVLRAAGQLPTPPSERRISEEVASYKLSELNDDQLDELLEFIEYLQDRDERRLRKQKLRESENSPETLKKQP